ncbi:helix-turn-helix transcriptional regulator [Fulvivirgaceae bacterium BMA12]|uniref:Helix-turn-helix transcriptional regulator n=1 Tax=Agaribacillus aureus TaxID=3051825 RepID=A0ABT8LHT1_9BACT|nr:helix-turn-helix transcriptional regulator [Fulvivirgaceae bacterium BMA12]
MSYHLTETEILETQNLNLFIIDKLLDHGVFELEEIGEYVPSFFHLNNKDDLTIEYLNQAGCDWLELTMDEINNMGFEFFKKYIHKDTLKDVFPGFLQFYQQDDKSKVHCDFQKVFDKRSQDYKLLFTASKIHNKRPGLITISCPVENSASLTKKLERMLGEQVFARKHYKQFSTLTKREVQVLTMLADGQSNPQIAGQLFLSRRTIEQHRKNINRKLEIKRFTDVIRYAQAFDLI